MAVDRHSRVSSRLRAAAAAEPAALLAELGTSAAGLTSGEAARRLSGHGPNVVMPPTRPSRLRLLVRAALNPLVVLLAVLAATSFASGDPASGTLMLAMLAIGVGLRFVQESRADAAVATLGAMIPVHATVLRDGLPVDLPLEELVPGDVVQLAAGDMLPADVRLLACKDLFVSQAVFTGESFPVEKSTRGEPPVPHLPAAPVQPFELPSICWLGTSVESGSAEAVVVATGCDTLLGGLSAALGPAALPTAFDRGLARFTWLMVAFVAVMVPAVFVVNLFARREPLTAALFALAVGVGLTPEMLPMIVAVCLSRGAIAMARQRVIVKQIDSIQNLGAMDILCTDKTGTLTLDRIILERHCDLRLREDREVLVLAWLNSHFQSGLRSVLDRAILEHEELREHVPHAGHEKVDEIPFDFQRRMMSVVVRLPGGGLRLVCKGAPEAVFARCGSFELDGAIQPIDHDLPRALVRECDGLAAEGFRVLAVAYRDVPSQTGYGRADERDLVLRGYVAFLDPPKDSAREALAALGAGGVVVKVLTGDNELVATTICREVGLPPGRVLLGGEVDALADAELGIAAEAATLLARLSPLQKERVIRALQARGHVVGHLGDGINDAPALRAADVGISVDSAVDIARASADCILLEKDLRVLEAGVREGRKVFVNILKYVRMGASSNFGNMLSVLGASLVLPFVPMTPLQILTNNLLYDVSQVPIPGDDVDPELVARPRPWSLRQIWRFILLVGPCSSLFDFLTFATLWFACGCSGPAGAAAFHTGWFLESLVTQTLVIHVIRTNRIPWFQSRASRGLTATTVAVVVAGMWLVQSPLGRRFGFVPPPPVWWPLLAAITTGYLALTWAAKRQLVRAGWLE